MAEVTTSIKDDELEELKDLTDGFNLVIDALKLNGITTI